MFQAEELNLHQYIQDQGNPVSKEVNWLVSIEL